MRKTVTFRRDHFEALKNHLLRPDGKEHVAFLLLGHSAVPKMSPSDEGEMRLLCRQIDLVEDEDLIENRGDRITWDNNRFLPILRMADEKGFGVGIIHSHPGGFDSFSTIDDENEKRLFQLAFNRNGSLPIHASFVMTPPQNLIGRIWEYNKGSSEITFFRVLGDKFQFQFKKSESYNEPDFLHRQKLAFGDALIEELSNLRVGVVGCGATGSATASLLSRLGVGKLVLIDKDTIEASNLNRLHNVKRADIGLFKSDVLKREIEAFGLGTTVHVVNNWVSAIESRNLLKKCDVVFGCSDDHAGRIFLNRFSYFYLVPFIDMGLTIHVSDQSPPTIQGLLGRVTVVFPGLRCLNCHGITSSEIAYAENLRRNSPEQYNRLKSEAYVIGEGNPNPAVGTFTTEVAALAVNEFLHRIQGYRTSGHVDHRIRLFHQDEDLKLDATPNAECRICGNDRYWGRGDMEPFMDTV